MFFQVFKDLATFQPANSKAEFHEGTGSPESSVTAKPGALYLKINSPGAGYIKSTGSGNTGWLQIGEVLGPATSTDNALARYNGTDGRLIQNSGILIDDSDNVTGMGTLNCGAITTGGQLTVNDTTIQHNATAPIYRFGGAQGSIQGFFFNENGDVDGAQFRYSYDGTAAGSGYDWRSNAAAVMELAGDGALRLGVSGTSFQVSGAGAVGLGRTASSTNNTRVIVGGQTTTSTNQTAFTVSTYTADNNATSSVTGISSGPSSSGQGFNTNALYAFSANNSALGAGDTATRHVMYFAATPTRGSNNASFADNASFSGNYFIHSSTTRNSFFGGNLEFGVSGTDVNQFNGSYAVETQVLSSFSGSSDNLNCWPGIRILSNASAKSVGGFNDTDVVGGRHFVLMNSGGDLTIVNESGTAVAGRRIITGTGDDVVIKGDGAAVFMYDDDVSRWRMISQSPSSDFLKLDVNDRLVVAETGNTQNHIIYGGQTGFYDSGGAERIRLDHTNVRVVFPNANAAISGAGNVTINIDSNANDTSSFFQLAADREGTAGGTVLLQIGQDARHRAREFTTTIANNQTTAVNVNGCLFDNTEVRGAKILYQLERRTDADSNVEMGEIFVVYDNENTTWKIKKSGNFDLAGVDFSITSGGQVQYTSDDLTGASYSGTLRVTQIDEITI